MALRTTHLGPQPGLSQPKGRIMLQDLAEGTWGVILSYLNPSDMLNLLLVNREIKSIVQRYLYHELVLTEWASSGERLAKAIKDLIVSDETIGCIRTLRLRFTSYEEIRGVLQLSLEIEPRMTGLQYVEIEAFSSNDAIWVGATLAARYVNCMFGIVAVAPMEHEPPSNFLCRITKLHTPRLLRRDAVYLTAMEDLELDRVIDDGSCATLPCTGSLRRLSIRYNDYQALGAPSCTNLELWLDGTTTSVIINDPQLSSLKLAAITDLPEVAPRLHTPSLQALILCNLAPQATLKLFANNKLDSVEFMSIAPVTIPALQALMGDNFFPSLSLVVAMVMHASFLTEVPTMRCREKRELMEWLQTLATTYPVDVRDFSHLLKKDIYFSQGLWVLAAHTRYRRFLPLVTPPPLK